MTEPRRQDAANSGRTLRPHSTPKARRRRMAGQSRARLGGLLVVEPLEDRMLLTNYSVTSNADSGSNTLRAAIDSLNSSGGATNTITFDLPSDQLTIALQSALPAITKQVDIEGNTQSGFSGTPLVVITGGSAGTDVDGLTFASGSANSSVQSLVINDFASGAGIDIETSNVSVVGNYIGTDPTGTTAAGNSDGIDVSGSGCTIGGTSDGAGNVISGNLNYGLSINAACLVQGNLVGTNAAGTASVPNVNDAVTMAGSGAVTIGGTTASARNVIAGNSGNGVVIGSPCLFEGNYVGLNAAGTAALKNGSTGVYAPSDGVTIGGTTPGAGNVISGNAHDGIDTRGTCLIEGNLIGTNAAGTAAIGNGVNGITPQNAGATIGGSAAAAANVLSGNINYGIEIGAPCLVLGNLIGTNQAGTAAVPNGEGGIEVTSTDGTIGGTTTAAANIIAGNTGNGIDVENSVLIEGNLIGLNASGLAIPNTGDGIDVSQPGATIGGTTTGAGNTISGNTGDGIEIESAVIVQGNRIGTNSAGTSAVPNGENGIDVETSGITVGGTTSGAGNTISGNTGSGINIEAACLIVGNMIGITAGGSALPNGVGINVAASGATIGGTTTGTANIISGNSGAGIAVGAACLIEGNLVGTNQAGTVAVSNLNGIVITAPGATIGGTTTGTSNTISGNANDGIQIGAVCLIEGNLIGLTSDGLTALRQADCIDVQAPGATIGGTIAGAGNTISGAGTNGINVGAACLIEGNYIGTDPTGTSSISNNLGIAVNASGATIGGTVSGSGNTISGNGAGITVSAACLIEGNLIGTNATGTAGLGNNGNGINVNDAGATIGGTTTGAGNTISGNGSIGMNVFAACLIEGNLIGTDSAGTAALANGNGGIYLGNPGATVGGTTAAAANVISGNSVAGVTAAAGCLIEGNLIGTNLAGTGAVPNSVGISVTASGATIGGTTTGMANTISGNSGNGIEIGAACLVEGNLIGTNPSGTSAISNGNNGILVSQAGATIGGTSTGTGNVISGNKNLGITLNAAGLVEGNLVGTDTTGSTAIANANGGIYVGASGVTIGGSTAGAGNVISGNGLSGIATAAACVIEGNLIGTNESGTAALGNSAYGIYVNAAGATIGGTVSGTGNVISGNNGPGIEILAACLVEGNLIGTNQGGTGAVANATSGIVVANSGSTIGGVVSGAGNVISGNTQNGIEVDAACLIAGNLIGTNLSGTAAVPNARGIGVSVLGATIGGTTTGAANVISGNTSDGIAIGAACLVEGNLIGTNAAGTAAVANGDDGITISQSGATIGGTAVGAGNTISGNGQIGVNITVSGACLVAGNLIGTDITGSTALGNTVGGVVAGAGATIGGTTAAAANVISGNTGAGMELIGACLVQGNLIGTDKTGSSAVPNTNDGIIIFDPGATIGGTAASAGNVISGNGLNGIADYAESLIQGNLLGTNAAGTATLPNAGDGIYVLNFGGTIGGTTAAAANVISGNTIDGLYISGSCLIEGNFIGTNAAGASLPNGNVGIVVNSGGATIGGTTAGTANVISGNGNYGIVIGDSCIVEGNLIGTNPVGTAALANGSGGIDVTGAGATIGGTALGVGNTISGNKGNGIDIAAAVLVEGNLIGTNASGTAAVANTGNGIVITVSGATIGGTSSTAGNTISGNTQAGILISGAAALIEGNRIGTNLSGTAAVPNGTAGISTQGSSTPTIGGTTTGAGNLVSGNASDGLLVNSPCLVEGNLIGTNATGTAAIANGSAGIHVSAANATIGGTTAGAGNVISGNTSDGIVVNAACVVEGNLIGTNAAGAAALANGANGINLTGSGSTIGGAVAGAGNTISGNADYGILAAGACVIEGNLIGTNDSGTTAIANRLDGIIVQAEGVTIGGTAAGAGNLISGNRAFGIEATTASCLVEGNLIGTDATGTAAVPNQSGGILLVQGTTGEQTIGVTGAGNTIAFNKGSGVAVARGTTRSTIRFNSIFENDGPGIDNRGFSQNTRSGRNNTPVISGAGDQAITGTLNAAPNSVYIIDFYANPSGDASPKRPQGRTYLGSTSIATNAEGNAAFSFAYTPNTLQPFVSATATDASGTTSNFSAPVAYAVTATGRNFNAVVGVAFHGQVASFTTTDAVATAANFTATINFGDGTPSVKGTIVASSGGFIVVGTHTYAKANPAVVVTVTITDTLGASKATANSVADVRGVAGVLRAYGYTAKAFAGAFLGAAVAGFTDTDPRAFPGQFTASINWGDGNATSTGTIAINGAGFNVRGTHFYDAAGTYTLTVTITDRRTGASVVTTGTAKVAATPITIHTRTLSITPGTAFNGVVVTFTDSALPNPASQYKALINWGDGRRSLGSITASGAGFTVTARHLYARSLTSTTATVTVSDSKGRSASASEPVVAVPRHIVVIKPSGTGTQAAKPGR